MSWPNLSLVSQFVATKFYVGTFVNNMDKPKDTQVMQTCRGILKAYQILPESNMLIAAVKNRKNG